LIGTPWIIIEQLVSAIEVESRDMPTRRWWSNPGWGDAVQAASARCSIVDVFVVNKADRLGAPDRARSP
jgi:putative protein kinase ArgK-like GTPase of G3E family